MKFALRDSSCRLMHAARATTGRARGTGGHLDYGIDGPLTGDVGINVEVNNAAADAPDGTVVSVAPPKDPKASLPYFMQQSASGTGAEAVEAKAKVSFHSPLRFKISAIHTCQASYMRSL
jgi:hypothetical protein